MNPIEPFPLQVSAPGRICLFGEHQDYLGLPVIAAAIQLRIGVDANPRSDGLFVIEMPDTGETLTLDPNAEQIYAHHRDYLRSSLNVLRREGKHWPQGYSIVMRSTIPINAGASSSSAMTVMWLQFLLQTAEPRRSFLPEDLARWGYQAEVAEFGDPGGMMDHYCAALGGVLCIDTRPPFAARTLPTPLEGIVLGHSLQPKATLEALGRNRRDVMAGIEGLHALLPDFDLATTPLEIVEPLLARLPSDPARRLRTNLYNRDLTPQAEQALTAGDIEEVGRLLLAHHAQLRDGLDLSTEKIERMMEAALAAGALGGKINGSGGGGTMFVLAPGKEEAVAEAIRQEGGVPYIVQVDSGARTGS